MERHEKHHSSGASTRVEEPGVSHDSGTTYTRWTSTSPGSVLAQFSHRRSPPPDSTLGPPPAAGWRWTGEETAMITAPAVRARKHDTEPLVMVTAYDAPGARIADEAGVDIILVGDSLAMVVLGYDDTLSVDIDDMVHHTAAAARGLARSS